MEERKGRREGGERRGGNIREGKKRERQMKLEGWGEGVKEGKLDNDNSNNSLDPPGGTLPEAPPLSLSLSLSCSFSPSVPLPPSLLSSLLLLFHS